MKGCKDFSGLVYTHSVLNTRYGRFKFYLKLLGSLEHLQEFPQPTPNLEFLARLKKNCSPTTPGLFFTWENPPSPVEIYVRVLIAVTMI